MQDWSLSEKTFKLWMGSMDEEDFGVGIAFES